MGGTKQISLPKSPLLEERSLSSSYEFTRERLSWFTGYVGRGGGTQFFKFSYLYLQRTKYHFSDSLQ